LHKVKNSAFVILFNEVEQETTDMSRRSVKGALDAGPAVARKACMPARSAKAYIDCNDRCSMIPTDLFGMSCTHHERGCTLKLVEYKLLKQSQLHEIMRGMIPERQVARLSKMSGWLWYNSTRNNTRKHYLHRNFISMNIRKCSVIP